MIPHTLLIAAAAVTAAPHRDYKIVSGGPIPIEAAPFMASIGGAGSAYATHFCGGSVIAPDVVLTAAHCVSGESPGSLVVTTSRARLSDDASGARTRVSSIAVEPGWDGTHHDVAVLRLAAPVTAPPVALSEGGALEDPGASAAVAGWGILTSSRPQDISDDLRAVQLPVVGTSGCRSAFGRGSFAPAGMICAGGDGRDSCNGDSGGPLMGADGRQIGIVSFGGRRCGVVGEPAVYTRVSSELSWLAGVVSGAPAPGRAAVRFGRITCGPYRCRMALNVTGAPTAITVTARSRGRERSGAARQISGARWTVTLPIPNGNVGLTALPRGADGAAAGPAARLRISVGS